MSEDSELGTRESPMHYNGGVRTGAPAPPPEWRDYGEQRAARPPAGRPAASRHPHVDATHPPISCPRPRISEPLRGYRCPACGRRVHHEDTAWDATEAADRVLAVVGRALVQCWQLACSLPAAVEMAIGAILVAGGVLAILSLEGWIPR